MRKVIAAEYVSLDGVMEDPGPMGEFEHRGWTMPYWNDELGKFQSDLLVSSDALLLGRVTWEEFVASWPSRSGDPFTDKINAMKKYVASRSRRDANEWNSRLLDGDVTDAVRRLKQEDGGDLLIYGSSTLVNSLMKHGLIDVFRIMLYPIALGSGARLFTDGGVKSTMTLADATSTSTGVAVLTYRTA